MRRILASAIFCALAAAASSAQAAQNGIEGQSTQYGTRVELALRGNVKQDFYVLLPADKPKATLLLFTGGDGTVNDANFIVHARLAFVKHGFATAVFELPSDHAHGYQLFRHAPEHSADIAAVVDWLSAKIGAPVWLVGTSMGSNSAAEAAAHGVKAAGIVLTSSVTKQVDPKNGQFNQVLDAKLEDIRVPVLIVHNKNDACPESAFAGTDQILARLTSAPTKELIAVSSTQAKAGSNPCQPFGPHGYMGIEDEVTGKISAWILAH